MPYGTPWTKYFTDLTGVGIGNSTNNPGTANDTGSPLQNPRSPQNVVIRSETGVPGGKGKHVRLHCRPLPVAEGKTPANWFTAARIALPAQAQKWGKWRMAIRRGEGQNTKGVFGRWPTHPSGTSGWTAVPPGTANEFDDVEWFDQDLAAEPVNGDSIVHYRKSDGTVHPSYQKIIKHPLVSGITWSAWHVVECINLPDITDMLIDGVRSKGYPLTGFAGEPKAYLMDHPFYWFAQSAMLVDPGLTRSTTPRESSYMDVAWVEITPWTPGTVDSGVAPTIPQDLAGNATGSTTVKLTWSPSSDPDSTSPLKGYVLERRPTGQTTWAVVSRPTATSYDDSGLTADTSYDYRVSAEDTAGRVSSPSAVVAVRTAAAGAPVGVVAKLVVRSADGSLSSAASGTISGVAPLTLDVDSTGSTGPINKVTIDFADGSTYPGVTTGVVTHEWANIGQYKVTLTVEDTTTGVVDTDIVTVTATDPTGSGQTPNLGVGLFVGGLQQAITARDLNEALLRIDAALGNVVRAEDFVQDPTGVLIRRYDANLETAFPVLEITNEGAIYLGDGTFDPRRNDPVVGATRPAPPTSGVTLSTVAWPLTSTEQAAASTQVETNAATSDTVTLPELPAGSTAVIAYTLNQSGTITVTPPAGWTMDKVSNGAGGCTVVTLRRHYAALVAAGSTAQTTWGGTGCNFTRVAAIVKDAPALAASSLKSNATTAQTSHKIPGDEGTGTATGVGTTQTDQLVLTVVGGRTNGTTARTFEVGTDQSVILQVSNQAPAAGKSTAVMLGWFRKTDVGTTSVRTATTGGSMLTVGGQYALTRP